MIGFVISVALLFGGGLTDLIFKEMIGLSFVLFIAGLLMSATKPDRIKVVAAGPTV